MPNATLTSKGQLTVPREVRARLGLEPGDRVSFTAVEDGYKLVALHTDVRELRGRFAGRRRRAASIDELNEAIAQEASGVLRRGRGKRRSAE